MFVAFLGVTVVLYHRVFHGWFVADDFRWLEISNARDVASAFVGPWGHGAAYRPLPRVTYLLDFWIFGFSYPGWIATNLVLHALDRLHLVNSLRGQVVHTGASCPAPVTILTARFAELPIEEIRQTVLACPSRYFEFDRNTFRISETTKQRWLDLVKARPGMLVLP